jgi:hypothetical protein
MGDTDDKPSDSLEPETARVSIVRGSCFALLFGIVGFVTPVVIVTGYTVLNWIIEGSGDVDRRYDLCLLPTKVVFPAVATAFVFAGAGWATFARRGRLRFVLMLALISTVSVPSWFVLAVIGMSPPRYKCIDHPLMYPSEVLSFAIPPLVTAVVLTMMRGNRRGIAAVERREEPPTV